MAVSEKEKKVDGYLVACLAAGPQWGQDHYRPMTIIPAVWEMFVLGTWGEKNGFWRPFDSEPVREMKYSFYWTQDLKTIIPQGSKWFEEMAQAEGWEQVPGPQRFRERESNDTRIIMDIYSMFEKNAFKDWNGFIKDYYSLTKKERAKAESAYLIPEAPAPVSSLVCPDPAPKEAERKSIVFEEVKERKGKEAALAITAAIYGKPNEVKEVWKIENPDLDPKTDYDDSERRRIKKGIKKGAGKLADELNEMAENPKQDSDF